MDSDREGNSQTAVEFLTVEVGGLSFTVPKRYQNLKLISSGGRGVVCMAHDTLKDQNVAIKKLRRPFTSADSARRAYRECVLMKLINHQNVLGLLTAFTPQKSLEDFQDVYLVSELMDANFSLVVKHDSNIEHDQISYLMYQLLCAIKHIHSAGIIHRDLKPSSIVVKSDCSLKILDFGSARTEGIEAMLTGYAMTRYYRAPEVIVGLGYDKSVDMWAAGCILGETFKRRPLFMGQSHVDQWNKIVEQLGKPAMDFIEKLRQEVRSHIENQENSDGNLEKLFADVIMPKDSDELRTSDAKDLLSKMLVIDPDKRISAEDALKHPYINIWYDDEEVNGPVPCIYKPEVDSEEHTAEQFKEMIYSELMDCEKKDRESQKTVNEVPVELSHDPRTMELYETAIKEGSEKDNSIRLMVIGCYGQGKSSLVRRLTGQSLTGVDSTNGIEVNVCSGISNGSECWEVKSCDDVSVECVKRLVSVAKSTKYTKLHLSKRSDKPNPVSDNGVSGKNDETDSAERIDEEHHDDYISPKESDENKSTNEQEMDIDTNNSAEKEMEESESKIIPSVYSIEFEREIKKSDANTNEFEEKCLKINIWDFGGQFVYYATHQLFHARHAVYLLVFNIAKGLNEEVKDEDCPTKTQQKTMGNYLTFWVNSVHAFVGNETGTEPPIFLVGTHFDLLEEQCDIDDHFEEVRMLFDDKECAYHIQAEHFAVSNTDPDKTTLTALRKTVSEYCAKKADRFIPAKWIPLERSLKENRLLKIIAFDKVKEIDSQNEIPVGSDEQLKLFLLYHHENGTFFYFENEEDAINHVVLEPQFLIDAFRCIITAGKFCRVHQNLRKLWRRLCDEAILEKELLIELWNKDPEKEFLKFEKPLLFFLQRHRIIAEALAFDENTTSPHAVPLGFYIVPSLLKKTAEGVMEDFLCGKRYTHVSVGYAFESDAVLCTVYNRVTAAILGRWPVLQFQGNSLIYENAAACKIDLSHSGVLKRMHNSIELLVVNLCNVEDVCSGDCDAFRRFVHKVIEQELHKFQGSEYSNANRAYKVTMRCYNESHGYSGSLNTYEIETLQKYKKDVIGCPDHYSHSVNITDVMTKWFRTDIASSDIPKRQLTERELSRFSTAIGRDWEYLARQLGFPDAEIEQVCLDKQTTPSRIYEILRRWKSRKHDEATLDDLVIAVQECESYITVNNDLFKNLIDGIL